MKYAWIKEHKKSFAVATMCRILKVDRSSYYYWVKQGCITNKRDKQLDTLVFEVFEQYRQTYGTRRVKSVLLKKYGLIVSRRRIAKIMKYLGIKAKTKRRFRILTTDSNHNLPITPNRLQREFVSYAANNAYVGDITYINTQEGWIYLATVIDLYSRRVVGWAMDDTLKTSLVNSALNMAIKMRRPPRGLIWHTDRGSQYASYEHKDLLERYGIIQSMSNKGDCYDNAVAESFFHTLKTELTHHVKFETKREAHMAIFEYIEVFYNRQRLHSSNNYMSPVEFEEFMMKEELEKDQMLRKEMVA